MNKNFINVTNSAIDRYNKRYNSLGNNVKSLGWGSLEQQKSRFENTIELTHYDGLSILDIGCGFGDYISFIKGKGLNFSKYEGWDINRNFINEAIKKNKDTNVSFKEKDILNHDFSSNIEFDATVMLGLLNFNLKSKIKNLNFSRAMIENAFKLTKKFLIVDFLSANLYENYPKEDQVFYHSISDVISICENLSNNFIIKHDYKPIPQKEFMVIIYK